MYPSVHTSLLASVHAMSHWSGSPTLSVLILTETALRCPLAALSQEDPAALVLQVQPLHGLQQLTGWVDGEVGQLRALDLGLCGR